MFGFGSVENITTTGSIPPEMLKQSEPYKILYGETIKNRYAHRLTDNPGSIKVMEYLMSEACMSFFNPQA